MRHLILRQGARATRYGLQAKQIRMQSTVSQKLSIIASPKATQTQVLNKLKEHVSKTKWRHNFNMDGFAILASKQFTSWVEDGNFMSAILGTLSPLSTPIGGLHVLSGITDGVSPHQLSGEPRPGFSILNGPVQEILPSLYHSDQSDAGFGPDQSSCVSLLTQPLKDNDGRLEVTVPLANTVFQNGRRSTLYATRWDVIQDGSIVCTDSVPLRAQDIITLDDFNSTLAIIPLLPLTPPRKIISGLGNIVRQLEVDSSATPASKELEAILPRITEERYQHQPGSPDPIGVWCWAIPPHVINTKRFDDLRLFKAGSSQTEADLIVNSNELFSELLSSGCRLHKILSGGGGWGLKQGLLSLDPETSFPVPGRDDDMEMFIRSFEQRNSAESNTGLASPGWSLLFCAGPQAVTMKALSSQWLASTKAWHFGVAPHVDDTSSPGPEPGPVEIITDHFGISAAAGLYLKKHAGKGTANQGEFTTKVDVPGTQFHSSKRASRN